MTIKKNTTLEGYPPTEEETFYVSWGLETIKKNLSFANEVLRQFVTLNSVLLGSSIAFLDEKLLKQPFRILVLVTFLVSLIVSFFGIIPYEGSVDLRIPEEIKQYKKKALRFKRICLAIAGCLLILGFAFAFVGWINR